MWNTTGVSSVQKGIKGFAEEWVVCRAWGDEKVMHTTFEENNKYIT